MGNPHTSDSNQVVEAASRSSRLMARVIDGLSGFLPLLLFAVPCLGLFVGLALLLAMLVADLYLLVTRGQTLGKLAMGIYIMRADGNIPNVGWLLVREAAIPAGVAVLRYFGHNDPSPVGQALQVLLVFAWVIDSLFIFGHTRRCLHDFVAGTHVVKI